jgi:hypothetical protein
MSDLKSLFHVSNRVDKSNRVSYEESQAIVALANAVVENAKAISAICDLASISGPVANVSNCNFYNNAPDTFAMRVDGENPEEIEEPEDAEEVEGDVE